MSNHYAEVMRDGPIAYWRMSDEPFVETLYRYNKAVNPALAVDTSGNWYTYRYNGGKNQSAFAGSRQTTDGPINNGAYFRATSTAVWGFKSWVSACEITPVVGTTYMVSMYVRVNRAQNVTLQVESIRSDGSAAGISIGNPVALAANTWTRISRAATPPANSVKMRGNAVVDSLQNGDRLEVSNVMYEPGTTDLKDYFDGGFTDAAWDGTVGKSSSTLTMNFTRRYLNDERGVYRGTYSASGVTYGIADYPQGGDGASLFAPEGSAEVVAGTNAWNFTTIEAPAPGTGEVVPGRGTWSIEFLARIDSAGGGRLFTTGIWEIVALADGSLSFRATGSGSGPTIPDAWTQGVWGHFVIAFNGEGLTFYVDGQDVNTFFGGDIDATGSQTLTFAPDSDMTVALDEVAVYAQFLNDGRVSAHYIGLSQIFAEYPLAARIHPPIITFNFDSDQIEQQLTVYVQYSGGFEASPLNIVWSVSDPTVASISETGFLIALAPGSTGVTATMPDLGLSAIAGVTVLTPEYVPSDYDRALYADDSMRFVWQVNPVTLQKELVATTHEYWEIDQGRLVRGEWIYDTPVPLATLAYNISTLEGREGIPVSDSENVRIATRPGRRWIPKTPEQKQLSLAMWVLGADKEGRFPSDLYMRTRFWENYNMLKKLFAVWDRQLLLTRRVPTRYGIVKMYAWVEPVSNMDLSPTGPMRATFTVDLVMSDPFYFGDAKKTDPVTVRAEGGLRYYPRTYRLVYSAHGAPGIVLINNEGTHDARLKAILRGPFKNPKLKNVDTREIFRLMPDVPIEKGTYIEIDFWEKSILLNGDSSRYWWMDRDTDWLKLRPGYSRFMFTHEGWDEDSTVEWQWRPSYL